MSTPKTSVSDKFTSRDETETHAHLHLTIMDKKVVVDFVTPDDEGYLELHVPWSQDRMDKYLNPWVFEETIERVFSVEVGWKAFDRRVDLEDDERRLSAKEHRKSKRKKS